jgi:hypothetical protein
MAPQCGAHTPPAPQHVFGTQAQPGGHWLELVHDGTSQKKSSAQKQQPSVVMKQ